LGNQANGRLANCLERVSKQEEKSRQNQSGWLNRENGVDNLRTMVYNIWTGTAWRGKGQTEYRYVMKLLRTRKTTHKMEICNCLALNTARNNASSCQSP
jgi:hypothetical protein